MSDRYRALLSPEAASAVLASAQVRKVEPLPAIPDRLRDVRNPGKPVRRRSIGGFSAAEGGNLFAGWARAGKITDVWLRAQLEVVRARSRDLRWNNDYARNFLALVQKHVIGPSGIQFKNLARNVDGTLDVAANLAIEAAYANFSRKGNYTLDGKLSRLQSDRLWIRTIAVDGETLMRQVPGADNPSGFAVEHIAMDYLDVQLCKELPNGNYIYLGIEFNGDHRAVAYWLLTRNPNGERFGHSGNRYNRVAAEVMHHSYLVEDIDQSRGVPWMVSGMSRLKMLGGYEEAALIGARTAASKMGFFTKTGDVTVDPPHDDTDDDGDGTGDFIEDADPGSMSVLPEGYDVKTIDWQSPDTNFSEFVQACLRGFASGVATGYNSVANNLEKVNYGSLRQGTLEDRDGWRMLQSFVIEENSDPIERSWLRMQLATGRILVPAGPNGKLAPLPFSKLDKFACPSFRPRGWAWIDPQKEGAGNELALQMGVTSRTAIAAATGRDLADVLDEIADENALAKAKGVSFGKADALLGFPSASDIADAVSEVINGGNGDE